MRVLGSKPPATRPPPPSTTARPGLLAHEIHSQVELHAAYGGVVPELASRDHVRKLLPLMRERPGRGRRRGRTDRRRRLHRRARAGRGAAGRRAPSRRSLAYAWECPAIGVHHMEGHLLAPLLEDDPPRVPVRRAAGFRAATPARRGARPRALPDPRRDRSMTRPARPSTRRRSCWACPTRAGRSSRALARAGPPGRFEFPRPLTRSARARLQLQRAEDRGRRGAARTARARRPDARRRRARVRGSRRRYARRSSAARARGRPAPRRSSSRAASARTAGCARACSRLGEQHGVRVVYPRAEFCTDNAAMIALLGTCGLAAGERDDLVDPRAGPLAD